MWPRMGGGARARSSWQASRGLGGPRGCSHQETGLRPATQTGTFSVAWPCSALRERAT